MKALTLCFCDLLRLFLNIFNAQRCWKGGKLYSSPPSWLWASWLWALCLIHCFFCLLIQVTNPAAFLSAMAGSWVGALRCLTWPSQVKWQEHTAGGRQGGKVCVPPGRRLGGFAQSRAPSWNFTWNIFTDNHFLNNTFPVIFQKSEVIATTRPQTCYADALQVRWVSEFR